jgi:tetratricopeptide (TPR) repeat protein
VKRKVRYLFDTQDSEIGIDDRTLHTPFEMSPRLNYKMALLRIKIGDYTGAFAYLNECLKQDYKFQRAYNLKAYIYIELNQYENAILNFFKSVFIDVEIHNIKPPRIYNLFYKKFIECEEQKRTKILEYLKYYERIAKKCYSSNEFAESLISMGKFEYGKCSRIKSDLLFIMLVENKTI